jgi:hypothetical protein
VAGATGNEDTTMNAFWDKLAELWLRAENLWLLVRLNLVTHKKLGIRSALRAQRNMVACFRAMADQETAERRDQQESA